MTADGLLALAATAYIGGSTVLFAVAISLPRVYLRIGPPIATVALTGVGASLCIAFGVYLGRLAITRQGADAYAITTDEGHPDYDPSNSHVMNQIAGASDGILGSAIGMALFFLLLYLAHLGAAKIAGLAVEDSKKDVRNKAANRKGANKGQPGA